MTFATTIKSAALLTFISLGQSGFTQLGVGAKAPAGAEVLMNGSNTMLKEKWAYWKGPGFSAGSTMKWKAVADPVDKGTAINGRDAAAGVGAFGSGDIVTKKKFKDFRLHVEFLVQNKGGNSGVYLQNRYEIQILDGDSTSHGMGAVINQSKSPYKSYKGLGIWNAYDLVFRAARFKNGKMIDKAMVTLYFNGVKVHTNERIQQVWGGKNSGIDGGNKGGTGITDSIEGLKLQAEGHNVLFRNIWIKELALEKADTNF